MFKRWVVLFFAIWSPNALAEKPSEAILLSKELSSILKADSRLKSDLLKLAVKVRTENLNPTVRKPIITIIDYSIPSSQKRLWVVDLEQGKILYHSLVAHGQNSGEKMTDSVSNQDGSHQTSVGFFVTGNTYFGKEGYSLRLYGLEKGFNDNAYRRGIVMHGAAYVSDHYVKKTGRIGRSWGCPAVEGNLAGPIINTIKEGTLIFAFYPDQTWLRNSNFLSLNKK